MWEIVQLAYYPAGPRYIIRSTLTGGFLSDNGLSGGTIHFLDREAAEAVVEILNMARTI